MQKESQNVMRTRSHFYVQIVFLSLENSCCPIFFGFTGTKVFYLTGIINALFLSPEYLCSFASSCGNKRYRKLKQPESKYLQLNSDYPRLFFHILKKKSRIKTHNSRERYKLKFLAIFFRNCQKRLNFY